MPATPPLTTLRRSRRFAFGLALLLPAALVRPAFGGLEEDLRQVPAGELAAAARTQGDAGRGALVFFRSDIACSKCHTVGREGVPALGPDLTALGKEVSDESLVEAILFPSKVIRKGFEAVNVISADGKSRTGIPVERTPEKFTFRDLQRGGETTTLPAEEIDEIVPIPTSIMPTGQVDQLNNRGQFLDLIRYLAEIRDGGSARARELQPPAALLAVVLPEYEAHLDHAGLIAARNDAAYKRGEAIYNRVCANCHGTHDKPGSLPTSLRFAEGKFKNGSDPLAMYRTLTHGFGLMMPQSWMVPSQKYDVVHYVREAYLKTHNPSQYTAIDAKYLAGLPKGKTRGPEPSTILPWSAMDYGPSLTHTFEVPGLRHNIAYKGVAVRVDPGPGGVSRGRRWMMFDVDTLRVAAAWSGTGDANENFIDWRGIQFDGAHGVHPRLVGRTAFVNSDGPGWADPDRGTFADDLRVKGRDGRRYGPLPRTWGRYLGQYHHGSRVAFSYRVGSAEILESPGLQSREGAKTGPLFTRTFNIGPRERDLTLEIAEHPTAEARTKFFGPSRAAVTFAPPTPEGENANAPFSFDGNSYLEIADGDAFDLTGRDFTIIARIKTTSDGTLWSRTQAGPKWTPDGQTWFLRDGRLCFDIGWVGAVGGKTKVTDGRVRTVAVTRRNGDNKIRLYVDGKPDGEGTLAAKAPLPRSVVRIGFTAPDFPRPASFLRGEISEIRFLRTRLTEKLDELPEPRAGDADLWGRWLPGGAEGNRVVDATGRGYVAEVRRGLAPVRSLTGPLTAAFAPAELPLEWISEGGRLRLRIPAGPNSLRFVVRQPADGATLSVNEAEQAARELAELPTLPTDLDLTPLTRGGPIARPHATETKATRGKDDGPFAVDILTAPETNPWLALTRFTGLDFLPDGRLAVCSWDGDVWTVETVISAAPEAPVTLRWRRIATGMFQPLGLKVVAGKIHVTCRDQLAVLEDLNGDGEIDFYRCLNHDHQVTEHFHEFAMGLQTDDAGNFYYAKSALHGLPAVVPHHGTLLRVSPDGSKTDILANGFRAANGVCLNPDGSFVVTDQEGFWNPKNRINWVTAEPGTPPKFYGNMLGYHDVTDPSDAAMEPPLCWITNAFDRSPAELLWVRSERWGALNGKLLNLSYGYGKVFVVPHEKVHGKMQGGMIELPLPTFPTGVMRGRFRPDDGDLYLCGMFAWAGNATAPGGLYRLRATGRPIHLPTEVRATRAGIALDFAAPLDPASLDVKNIRIKTWGLKRTAKYGSPHVNETEMTVRRAAPSADGKTITIEIADLQPTWCMEIRYEFRAADGTPVRGVIHNTIHAVAEK